MNISAFAWKKKKKCPAGKVKTEFSPCVARVKGKVETKDDAKLKEPDCVQAGEAESFLPVTS